MGIYSENLLAALLHRISGERVSVSAAKVAYGAPVVWAAFDRELVESVGHGRAARLILTQAGRDFLDNR